jgi:hypothetical protein
MEHLRRLGSRVSIPIPRDEEGFTGRECPATECQGYFKVRFGTGLKGQGLPCHCPYCGHTAAHDHCSTKDQIAYAKSAAIRKVTDALHADLKKLEFEQKPRGMFGIGISMKVTPGRPTPIHYYREKQLETEVVCMGCTLRYSVYGVFAYCPDCGQHNSFQILEKNLELVRKMLEMAATAEGKLAARLVENALEDCVSTFDGFGREACRVFGRKATDPQKAETVSFQNLHGANGRLAELFMLDLSAGVAPQEWRAVVRAFQKRHLLSHKMGIVDDEYVRKSGDTGAVIGRKISVTPNEVADTIEIVGKLARNLFEKLSGAEAGQKP